MLGGQSQNFGDFVNALAGEQIEQVDRIFVDRAILGCIDDLVLETILECIGKKTLTGSRTAFEKIRQPQLIAVCGSSAQVIEDTSDSALRTLNPGESLPRRYAHSLEHAQVGAESLGYGLVVDLTLGLDCADESGGGSVCDFGVLLQSLEEFTEFDRFHHNRLKTEQFLKILLVISHVCLLHIGSCVRQRQKLSPGIRTRQQQQTSDTSELRDIYSCVLTLSSRRKSFQFSGPTANHV